MKISGDYYFYFWWKFPVFFPCMHIIFTFFPLPNRIRVMFYMAALLFIAELYSIVSMCHLLFTHFLTFGHLFSFFFFDIVNNPALIRWVIYILWYLSSFFLEKNLWRLIRWCKGMPTFVFFNLYCCNVF